MSRIGNLFHKLNVGNHTKEEKEPEEIDNELTEAAEKDEKSLRKIFDIARKVYLNKKLIGSFEVSRTMGAMSSCVSCDFDGQEDEVQEYDHKLSDSEDLTRFEKAAERAISVAIESMCKRSRAYRKRTYAKDITLSSSISISDPFLGVLSVQFTCSASLTSLLACAIHEVLEKQK